MSWADAAGREVRRAERFPQSGAPIAGAPVERDERAFTLGDFPYRVITAVVRGERWVLAVAHTSRAPGYWRERTG